jgi:hypothetical protein
MEKEEIKLSKEALKSAENTALEILKKEGVDGESSQLILGVATKIIAKEDQWKALSEIEVKDKLDKKTVKLANKNRIAIKNERISAVEYLKVMGREPAQKKMENLKKVDTAFLRLIQHLEKSAKAYEDKLLEIEKYPEEYERQQREELIAKRMAEMSPLCNNAEIYPVGDLSEEAYQTLLSGLKSEKEKREKEEAEAIEVERLAKEKAEKEAKELQEKTALYNSRRDILLTKAYLQSGLTVSMDTSEEEWSTITQKLADLESENNKKQEELKAATKAAEERTKKQKDILSIGAKFDGENFVYGDTVLCKASDILDLDEVKFLKGLDKIKKVVDKQKEIETQAALTKQLEDQFTNRVHILSISGFKYDGKEFTRELFEPIPKDTIYTVDDEKFRIFLEKASRRIEKDKKEKEELLKAGGRELLTQWVAGFAAPREFEVSENSSTEVVRNEILSKFDAFLVWANDKISKM